MKQAVIGLGFGDEGKGLATSYLCSKALPSTIVVRFNGGHQAGHTVCIGDERHVFSSYGSGTLQGIPTYISEKCTFSPSAVLAERRMLYNYSPLLYVDTLCPVTTPFDVYHNRNNNHHGSVGVGFGTTIDRHEKHFKLHVQDLYYPIVLKEKLRIIADYYKIGSIRDKITEVFLEEVNESLKLFTPTGKCVFSMFDNVIYEGAQGIMLDMDWGFFPNVTRSNTTTKNIYSLYGELDEVYYVTRSYATRHGMGHLPGEKQLNLINNKNETNKDNLYQGPFRTADLDPSLIDYAIDCDNNFSWKASKNLIITCLDQYPINVKEFLDKVDWDFDKVFTSDGPSFNNIKLL